VDELERYRKYIDDCRKNKKPHDDFYYIFKEEEWKREGK